MLTSSETRLAAGGETAKVFAALAGGGLFGPWATAMRNSDAGLDACLKRRMAMLPSLNHPAMRAKLVPRMVLALIGVAVLVAPTVERIAESDEDPAAPEIASDQPADRAGQDTKPPGARSDGGPRAPGRKARSKTGTAAPYFPPPSAAETRILNRLSSPTSLEFIETPLEDILCYFKELHDVPLYIDRHRIVEAAISLEEPVKISLKGISGEAALRTLLKPHRLDFVVEDGMLKITTASGVWERLITRTYPVGDLVRDGGKPSERPQGLLSAITEGIAPDSWDEIGGPGSIVYVAESRSFVIRQSWPLHRKIAQLLQSLRDAKELGGGSAERGTRSAE